MTAIDLSRDLELWYEFDSNYFDSQQNVFQDQSGYGRHAELTGGPTVGAEGPNDFEAVSFDGSDDIIDSEPSLSTSEYSDAFTVHVLFNPNLVDDFRAVVTQRMFFGWMIRIENTNDLMFRLEFNDGTTTGELEDVEVDNAWQSATLIFDSSSSPSTRGFKNGNLVSTSTVGDGKILNEITSEVQFSTSSNSFSGRMALAGFWSRALSDAEVEYLNNLTAPRRSQL